MQEWGRGWGCGGGGEGEEEGVRERGRDEKKRGGGGGRTSFLAFFSNGCIVLKLSFLEVSCIGLGDLLAKN